MVLENPQNYFLSVWVLLFQQLMSLIATIVVIEVLYMQGVLRNTKDKIIEEKKELEEEKKYYDSR